MKSQIKTKTQRKDLAPRREPYWSRIKEGFFVGYRKISQGDGTWIARLRDNPKQRYRALGSFAEYDEAVDAARAWLAQINQGVTPTDTTVAEACRTYVKHLRIEKGNSSADDADGRFRRLVYEQTIGKLSLEKLQTKNVRTWLNAQVAINEVDEDEALRKSKDTANRNLASLKAALNFALKDRLVASDAGWKTVTPFTKVGQRRKTILSQTQRTALLKACPDDLRDLVKGLLLTAARPGELARATVADFDKRLGTMVLSGKTGPRTVTLSTTAKAFVTELCKGKLPGAPVFTTAYGKSWTKDDWKKPFKEAAHKAKLPADSVAYTLRHTAISEMIIGGMQTSLIAMLAGTSTAMIDKHYGHLLHDKTREVLDGVAML